MDFSLSDDQQSLRESVQRYCRAEFGQEASTTEGGGKASQASNHWSAFAQMGWLGILLPEEFGGTNGTIVEASIVLEEFGRIAVTEPFLACAVIAATVLRDAAASDLRRELLGDLATGKRVLVFAHAERAGRGDPDAISTTAHRDSGGYVLNGGKAFVLSGPRADRYLVSARLGEGPRTEPEIAVFAVDRNASGLSYRDFDTLDGRGASELRFENLKVDAGARLTAKDEGARTARIAIEYAIAGVCAEAIGAMDDVIKVTADYLKTRRAYGTTLSTFQALQHRLADMLVEHEMSRSIFYRLLAAFSNHDESARVAAVSAAKALIGGSAKFVGANGIQLHGAMGMSAQYIIGRHFKQLSMIEGMFGNSNFHWQRRAGFNSTDGVVPREDVAQIVQTKSRVRAI